MPSIQLKKIIGRKLKKGEFVFTNRDLETYLFKKTKRSIKTVKFLGYCKRPNTNPKLSDKCVPNWR